MIAAAASGRHRRRRGRRAWLSAGLAPAGGSTAAVMVGGVMVGGVMVGGAAIAAAGLVAAWAGFRVGLPGPGGRSGKLGERAGHRCGQPARPRESRPRFGQQAGRGRPLGGIFFQAARDQRAYLGGQPVEVRRAEDHAVDQRRGRAAAERAFAGRGKREDRAQAENVAGRAHLPAVSLLRGHESGRADYQARTGQRTGLHRPRNTEIDHPGPVVGQQHVRGLQVTVHDARGVDSVQALRQARGQRQDGSGQAGVRDCSPPPPATGPSRRPWPATAPGRPDQHQ